MIIKDSEKWKRPANEGYVDAKDVWYWHRTENLVSDTKDKMKELIKEETQKASELAKVSTLASVTAAAIVLLAHFYVLRKSR